MDNETDRTTETGPVHPPARKRLVTRVVSGCLIAAVAFSLYRIALGVRTPERLASTQDWIVLPCFGKNRYYWLTPKTILHGSRTSDGGDQLVGLDIQSGKDTSIPALDHTRNGRILGASPDGKWLLWSYGGEYGVPTADAIDGTQQKTWQTSWTGDNQAWLPDSSGWVSLPGGHSIDWATEVCTLQNTRPRQVSLLSSSVGRPSFSRASLHLAGITAQNHAIAADLTYYGPADPVRLIDIDLSQAAAPPKEHLVQPAARPADIVAGILMAPRGDRLAWMVITRTKPGFLQRLLKSFAPAASSPRRIVQFWMSRPDGTDFRLVGELDAPEDDPTELQWQPGGHQLSFVYQTALWTVQAD